MPQLRAQLKALHADAFRWALHQARDPALAEDALQAAYVALLDGSATCRDSSAFKSFLFGLIRNKVRSLRRRQLFSRFTSLDLKALNDLATTTAATPEPSSSDPRITALRQAILELSPRH